MICITRGFGAPVTDAGGNVARTSAPTPVPARRRPRTVLTRWCRPGWASSSPSPGTTTEPGEQRAGIDGLVACQATGQVDLVTVTGADVLEDRRHAPLERDAIETRVPARERGRGDRACTVARRFGCPHQQASCFAASVEL